MAKNIFHTEGSIAVQAMVSSNQESLDNHTMKLVFNQYPAINQWMKLVNVKSDMLYCLV